jgi:hypothetical protein
LGPHIENLSKRVKRVTSREDRANLGDSSLHDHKIGVIDIQLYRLEQTKYSLLLNLVAVENILRYIRQSNLNCDDTWVDSVHITTKLNNLPSQSDLLAVF